MKDRKESPKGRASALVKVMYVISAVFAAVSVYMLIANILYINTYTASYGMTFADMWSEAIQYIISGFILYFAAAVIIFGIGKIISMIQQNCLPSCEAEDEKDDYDDYREKTESSRDEGQERKALKDQPEEEQPEEENETAELEDSETAEDEAENEDDESAEEEPEEKK